MRKGFTLVELMVSIAILSIIVIFLYQSYAQLLSQNRHYEQALEKLQKYQKIKKLLYLDILLAKERDFRIEHQDKQYDSLFFQTKNSIFERIRPYVAYVVKQHRLYRIESLLPIRLPLDMDQTGVDVNEIGELEYAHVYRSSDEAQGFLVEIKLKDHAVFVLKIKPLGW